MTAMGVTMQLPVHYPLGGRACTARGGSLAVARSILRPLCTTPRRQPLRAFAAVHNPSAPAIVSIRKMGMSSTSMMPGARGGRTRAMTGSGLQEVVTALSSASSAAPSIFGGLPLPAVVITLAAGVLAVGLWSFLSGHKREEEKLEAALNLPPGDLGSPALGETLEYVKDMRHFVKEKTKTYGPVWKTHLFGKPTVMLGGPQAVKEFMDVEAKISESSLPPSFVELTTDYMSLNQSGERLRSSRANLGKILSPAAMEVYLPTIESSVDQLLNKIDSPQPFSLSGEVRDWSLDLFLQIFMGLPFTDALRERFDKFNSGLMGLVPVSCPFTALGKGVQARDSIQQEVLELLKSANVGSNTAASGSNTHFALEQLQGAVDETGEKWTDDRVSIAALLMVWGAYIEVAALVGTLMYILPSHPEVRDRIWEEVQAAQSKRGDSALTYSHVESEFPYLDAALKESQRFLPPTGPGMRTCEQDLTIAGYDIPAGWVISADPRIGWSMAELYTNPDSFDPNNFLGKERLPEDFFPGGIGSHQCPGIPLAYFVAKVFLSKFVERFEDCRPVSAAEPEWEAMPIMIIKDEYKMAVQQRSDNPPPPSEAPEVVSTLPGSGPVGSA